MTALPPGYAETRLQGITDLTVFATIKDGFVPNALETITYVERMRRLFTLLNGGRIASREAAALPSPFTDLVSRLNIVHFFRFAIIPPDSADSGGRYRMLMNVTFDGGWEPYMRVIWRDLGSLLDAICCNCEDYQLAQTNPFEKYIAWVRQHEIAGNFFYADSSSALGDHRYREHVDKLLLDKRLHSAQTDVAALTYELDTPEIALRKNVERVTRLPARAVEAGLRSLVAIYAQARWYPKNGSTDADVLLRFTQDLQQEFFVLASGTLFEQSPYNALKQRYGAELAWLTQKVARWTAPPDRLTDAYPQLQQKVQGGILDSYANVTHGCFAMLRIAPGQTANALAYIAKWQVSDGTNQPIGGMYRNLAFTHQGLRAFGLSAERLASFPQEFVEGMEARAGVLGDLRGNHPEQWNRPTRNWQGGDQKPLELSTVHVVVQLRTQSNDPTHDVLPAFTSELKTFEQNGFRVLSVQPTRRYDGGSFPAGHFGFPDGISQPRVIPIPSAVSSWNDAVGRGEILLGYRNSRGDGPLPAEPDSLLDNGSFLVVRKLRQRLDVLDRVLTAHATSVTDSPQAAAQRAVEVKEKMMGWHLTGKPLVTTHGDANDFDYDRDPTGAECPFHSHARRLNPRKSTNVPRIVRRGMSYGPKLSDTNDASVERGVLFMAYNANIAEQFEQLQRWISGGTTRGFTSCEGDPFLGVPEVGSKRTFRYLRDGEVVRVDLGDEPIVHLEWGLYLFTPSIDALRNLPGIIGEKTKSAKKKTAASPPSQSGLTPAGDQWKLRVEDNDRREATWATVCDEDNQGALDTKTDYGVLVGSHAHVTRVLSDDGKTFSVKGYGARLDTSIGNGYLGQDPAEQDPWKQAVNDVIATVSSGDSFDLARAYARDYLDRLLASSPARVAEVVFPTFIDSVLAMCCKKWFGLPDGTYIKAGGANATAQPAVYPGHSYSVGQYVFWPHPAQAARVLGMAQGAELLQQARLAVKYKVPLGDLGSAIETIVRKHKNEDDVVAQVLMGVMQGFPPTVNGNLLFALGGGVRTKMLWDLQADLLSAPVSFQTARGIIEPYLLASMCKQPVPSVLWRTALQECPLSKTVTIKQNTPVVVGLFAAARDENATDEQRNDIVFGGQYPKATHACPGRSMAMGVMLGTICALLEAGTLRPTASPLIVTLRG